MSHYNCKFYLRAIVLWCMTILAATTVDGANFSKTYAPYDDGWEFTNFTGKTNPKDGSKYLVVPDADNKECIVTIKSIFNERKISSDVVVTLKIATSGSGNNPDASTFSLYSDGICKNPINAIQSGTFPSNATDLKEISYTVKKTDALFSDNLAIKITKPGKQVSLYSVTIEFSYEEPSGDPVELADVALNGEVGKQYTVKNLSIAGKFEANGKRFLVVKDNSKAVRNFSMPDNGDKFFKIAGANQQEYSQNNWLLLTVPIEQYAQAAVGNTVSAVTGTLTDNINTSLEAESLILGEENTESTFFPNVYCPVNFMGESSVTALDGNYYFATPKANEYAKVVWAVFNDTDGAFYLPASSGSVNTQNFKGGFKVDYALNSTGSPELANGNIYEFDAVIKLTEPSTRQTYPRKVDANTTVSPSEKYVVFPVNLTGDSNIVTEVKDMNVSKDIKTINYYNLMGIRSASPFSGINIVVTTYTDGTSSSTKLVR